LRPSNHRILFRLQLLPASGNPGQLPALHTYRLLPAQRNQPMKHLFGPVNSRRLGLSLGIDLLPRKTCSFDCIYCEQGTTTALTCVRREYIPTGEICDEIDRFLVDPTRAARVDVFTVTASGEPTLHSGLGEIIRHLKKKTNKPVAVLTNGSLLHLGEVRCELGLADIVVPSLDSARLESFRKINRPAREVELGAIIDGLVALRQEGRGELWLETLFVRGVNDSAADITALNHALRLIQPHRIQCNTVVRPPAEAFAAPLTPAALKEVQEQLAGPSAAIGDFSQQASDAPRIAAAAEILPMLKRRPCTTGDICQALGTDRATTEELLASLLKDRLVQQINHNNQEYYQVPNE
jgi:wyosine [tRNA(Phe)-imidazoG37] synthetase (radical SAM superfamily)